LGRYDPLPIAEVLDGLSSRWTAYRSAIIDQTIAPLDDMLLRDVPDGVAHYMAVGVSALEGLSEAMLLARRTRFDRILDLPCGGGRVTRHLRAFFPESEIVVSDLDKAKEAAVKAQFAVAGLDVPADFNGTPRQTFDLIFVGSLLTHLNGARIERALGFLLASLENGGLLVCTTHGRGAISDVLANQRKRSALRGAAADLALKVWLPRAGHLYRGSRHHARYGTSLTMPSWILRRLEHDPRTRILGFKERAWISHQDLMIVQRTFTTA
jgi:SAM-dependent methyltransferase